MGKFLLYYLEEFGGGFIRRKFTLPEERTLLNPPALRNF
jgi:hypothetical protein